MTLQNVSRVSEPHSSRSNVRQTRQQGRHGPMGHLALDVLFLSLEAYLPDAN